MTYQATAGKWTKLCFLLLISANVLAAQDMAKQESAKQDAAKQDVLTNQAIVELVKAKVGESVIVGMIRTLPTQFLLTKDAVIKLKQQGVSDKVLAAMVAKASSAAPASAPPAPESQPLSNAERIASSASVGTWEIRDKKDPMTDREFYDAHLVAKDDRRERIEVTATCPVDTTGGPIAGLLGSSTHSASQDFQFNIAYAAKAGQGLARTAMAAEVERAPEVFGTTIGNDRVIGGGSCVYTRVRVGDTLYRNVNAGGCGGKNVVSISFSSAQLKASDVYGGIAQNTGGDPGKQRAGSFMSSLFPMMDAYAQAQLPSQGVFSANDFANANVLLVELPVNDGTVSVVPLPTQEPSFKKFEARCAAEFARLAPPAPAAAPPPPKPLPSLFKPGTTAATPWGNAMMHPPQFAGSAEEFAAALPGFLQKAAQAAGFDAPAYEKESAFVIDYVRTCAQITPEMAAQATWHGQVVTRNIGPQYAICQSGASPGMNAKYPDTQILLQCYANWLRGKGFTVFVIFRAKEAYPIVSATITGPR
jgi:hypothetical protein